LPAATNATSFTESMSTTQHLTYGQRDLLARLQAITDRHRWLGRNAKIEVMAGPRAFDVRCSNGPATLWHWVGTADQILESVDRWFTHRRTTHAYEFLAADFPRF